METNFWDLPTEIITDIALSSYDTFRALLDTPNIGTMLCSKYSQEAAKRKFTTTAEHKYLCDVLHGGKEPAIKYNNGSAMYYRRGKLHRRDGPALIYTGRCGAKSTIVKTILKYMHAVPDTVELYFIDGKLHREDGPAVIINNNTYIYYILGCRHREDGPAYIAEDVKKYYIGGELHRGDGPAVMYQDGSYEYYYGNKLHREGGPAVFYTAKILETMPHVATNITKEYGINIDYNAGVTMIAYMRNGALHRDNSPALIFSDGSILYCKYGIKHRVDGPAIITQ
jgi:hypothetical protein